MRNMEDDAVTLDDLDNFDDEQEGACPDCGATEDEECEADCPSREEDEAGPCGW